MYVCMCIYVYITNTYMIGSANFEIELFNFISKVIFILCPKGSHLFPRNFNNSPSMTSG